MNNKYKHGLGAIKDKPDGRDFLMSKIIAPPTPLPAIYDLEHTCSPVRDQGHRGACVAFSSVATKEQHRKANKQKGTNLSEEFVYDQIMQDGGGAQPRDAYKLFVSEGVVPERVLPYKPNEQDQNAIHLQPTSTQLTDAAPYKSTGYARLTTIADMKQSLVLNGAFMIGVNWLQEWFNPVDQTPDGYPLVKPGEGSVAGGHALCVVGYNDEYKAFKIKNSWGKSWGHKGFFYMSYDAVSQNLNDAWSTFDINAPHINKAEVIKLANA